MKFIKDYREGDRISDIYLCKHKQAAVTKNGKPYENVILQDKTGVMDAKIWDPNSAGIAEFDALDYIEVYGEITSFNGILQVNVKRVRKVFEGEYIPLKEGDVHYCPEGCEHSLINDSEEDLLFFGIVPKHK